MEFTFISFFQYIVIQIVAKFLPRKILFAWVQATRMQLSVSRIFCPITAIVVAKSRHTFQYIIGGCFTGIVSDGEYFCVLVPRGFSDSFHRGTGFFDCRLTHRTVAIDVKCIGCDTILCSNIASCEYKNTGNYCHFYYIFHRFSYFL